MSSEALTGLINNTALLLALAVLYDTFSLKPQAYTRWMQVVAGCFIGIIGIAVMLSPWTLTEGLVFDTRSILLSVAGLFFGLIPAVIAALMTAAFRLGQGGVGAWVGVFVIISSTAIGLGWRHYARNRQLRVDELYLFGVIVHAVMIMLMLVLPAPIAEQTIRTIGFPILVIYPVGSVLLSIMLLRQRARKETESALRENEARLRHIVQSMPVMLNAFDENYMLIAWNSECENILGYSADEIVGNPEGVGNIVSRPRIPSRSRASVAAQTRITIRAGNGRDSSQGWNRANHRVVERVRSSHDSGLGRMGHRRRRDRTGAGDEGAARSGTTAAAGITRCQRRLVGLGFGHAGSLLLAGMEAPARLPGK